MKLTYDDFRNRNIINISEDVASSFMDKALDGAATELNKLLGKQPEIKDIKEYLFSNIFSLCRDIKTFKNELFCNEIKDENFIWNVIIDNDVIIFDLYSIYGESKHVSTDFSYEIHLLNDGQCEVSLSICEAIKNDKTINVDVFDVGNILRLLFFVVLISNGLTK